MKVPNNQSTRRAPPTAWQRAEAYGIDVSLLEANLRLSVAERLCRHDAALRTILSLRKAVIRKHGTIFDISMSALSMGN